MKHPTIGRWKHKFSDMVRKLVGPDADYDLTQKQQKLSLMCLGISGEAGEVVDMIKKHLIYGAPLDKDKLSQEFGDLEFYMEAVRDILHMSRKQTICDVQTKLAERFGPDFSFTPEKAIRRKDLRPNESTTTATQDKHLPLQTDCQHCKASVTGCRCGNYEPYPF